MIVATAGHIDHGKTSLVRAMTGTDTDRLPEEKKRGLSIDLGFAYQHAEDGTMLGFVDVPGHEKFVKNMLAGVTGVDFGLLVVAADDGPMPQTLEHLSIIDLLGIDRGAVVVTKIDRVPPARIDAVVEEIRAIIGETALAPAPVFTVSTTTGEGIEALLQHLWHEARHFRRAQAKGGFRLAVDRVFSLPGSGGIVTGIATAGSVDVGAQLVHTPAGVEVRVRAIHVNGRSAERGIAGDRCALNLTGADLRLDRIARGDWIVAPQLHEPVDRFDARLRVLRSAAHPLRHWTPVHLHLAAAEVAARVAVLHGHEIAAGGEAYVQFVLERPIGALFGDRLIVRDSSARATLGGGIVIDPFPPQRGRGRPERMAILDVMAQSDAKAVFAELLERGPVGIDIDTFARTRNLTPGVVAEIQAAAPAVTVSVSGRPRAVAKARWAAICEKIIESLRNHHRNDPGGALPENVRPEGEMAALIDAAIESLIGENKIRRAGQLLRLAEESVSPDPDEALWTRIFPMMSAASTHPPTVGELSVAIGVAPAALAKFFLRMARKGRVAAVAENRYFEITMLAKIVRRGEEIAVTNGGMLSLAKFREGLGIGRNVAIELLEFFDRIGFTRRSGDSRKIIRDASTALNYLAKGGLQTVE